jgi:hypothetical protein
MSDNPDPRLDEIQARLDKANAEMDRLTERNPGSAWRWSIPANPERDSDLILSASMADVPFLLAELRKAHEALERVEALHKPVTVYELDDVNGTWIYDGDEKRVLTTLCAECTPDFVLSEIEEGDYDGGGSDADIYWPCPTKAAVAAAKGDGRG